MGRESGLAGIDPALVRFAEYLAAEIGATRVLLFGSHVKGTAGPESDYDLIVIADRFRSVPLTKRAVGLRGLFYSVGGDAPMDLVCLTPEEFAQESQGATLVSAVLPEAIDLLPIEAAAS